ncbi:MAG TPA: DNA polymerase III subunit epsilon [Bacteroidales bacterium]|nr:DNA polymerase III subunit epsilon [Bacteroidales bacterium]
MYAIIDIETTGLSPSAERIIEIAIYIHDGEKIVKEYTSLINPERRISPHITQITGITNEMVSNAPKFWEIAKDIVILTEGKSFVAHNATFDFNFIRNEFKSLGYDYKRNRLCTVKLSRKILPGLKSYSLGKLCDNLNIKIDGRHRAAGDALATVKLFEHLLKTDPTLGMLNSSKFYHIDASVIKNLPEEPGVYYFHDHNGEVVYIGKSKNLRNRVFSHFSNEKSDRTLKMIDEIHHISYELTGSELIALLLESDEIKTQKPKFNRRQRRTAGHYGIYAYTDEHGYICFKADDIKREIPIASFNSAKEARERLYVLSEKYQLCQKLCGLYETTGACFYYQLKHCKGACIHEESPANYNLRTQALLDELSYNWDNFFIIDTGRDENEKSIVKIENGKYIGFGYIDSEFIGNDIQNLSDVIKIYPDNRDVQQIIRSYLKQHSVEMLIKF